ncbi:hypothetical protein T492DRAFT_847032 [Pavlovales sp. CCMP2436]|nr:hypothetical protein T492DRAFT_847032 [Pavlovales sp. CCMP2436]
MPDVQNADRLTEIERMSQLGDQLREAQRARFGYKLRYTWIPLTLGIALGLAGVLLRGLRSQNMISDDVSGTGTVMALLHVSIPLTLMSAPPNSATVAVGLCLLYIALSSHVELRPLPGCDLVGFESFSVDMAVCSVPADKELFLTYGVRKYTQYQHPHTPPPMSAAQAARVPSGCEHLAGVSVRVMPAARAVAPAEATTPRRRGQCNCWRWCLLGLVAVLMVIYGVLFAAYASGLSLPILADCAACQLELRALSLDSHGYYNDDAGEARSGRAYRYSGTRAHVTRALSASAAAEVCASENGTLAVPRSTAEARRLSCIMGSDAFGVWIGVDPSEVEDRFIVGSGSVQCYTK